MAFGPPTARTIRWSSWEGLEDGLEHVDIRPEGSGTVAAGVIVGAEESACYGLTYRLVMDEAWRIREARLEATTGPSLHLQSDGQGSWRADGQPRPDLHGCIDIDIQATPLTNTLPIRRLNLDKGQSAIMRVAYIWVPSLSVEAQEHCYTALDPGAQYRFESLESGFRADLPVDGDGFVMNYPRLFRRLS
ncbi:putative glycolipid-binding domain-containing protein [Microvirga sp. GCM10011540]|uniref:putative glycolipid-binding domain-containing protein n=1 Tax=Microvirga sp. GCM10011540 TaxID=3317338 RepID=UPI00361CB4D5